MEGVLQIQNLVKSYNGKRVVDSIGMNIHIGEVVGLLGPNGAGKTTTFYMITGLAHPDSGNVILDGEDITGYPMYMRARKGINYLPQEPSVFKKLTVEENLMAILETLPMSPEKRQKRLESLLSELGISHLAKQKAGSLSGGERRRLEITRALITSPKFMLLDEPFAGIDPIALNDIKKIIRDLKARNIGIIISDHNVRETLIICDRAFIINEGKIICSGTPDEIVNNPVVRNVYLGDEFEL